MYKEKKKKKEGIQNTAVCGEEKTVVILKVVWSY